MCACFACLGLKSVCRNGTCDTDQLLCVRSPPLQKVLACLPTWLLITGSFQPACSGGRAGYSGSGSHSSHSSSTSCRRRGQGGRAGVGVGVLCVCVGGWGFGFGGGARCPRGQPQCSQALCQAARQRVRMARAGRLRCTPRQSPASRPPATTAGRTRHICAHMLKTAAAGACCHSCSPCSPFQSAALRRPAAAASTPAAAAQ